LKDKDVVLFMGTTGAGKTTTICYLIGDQMIEKNIDIYD